MTFMEKRKLERAVKNHHTLWYEIAKIIREEGLIHKSAAMMKDTARRRAFPRLRPGTVRDDCFLCQFVAMQDRCGERDCSKCPMVIDFPEKCLNGLFAQFHYACTGKDAQRALELAVEIANLPVINPLYGGYRHEIDH